MELSVAEILVLTVAAILTGVESELSLQEAHVCLKTETYQERTQTTTLKPRELTRKKPCWDITKLFTCKKKMVIWEHHTEYVMVPRSKIVARCCDGYVEVEEKCVPHCEGGCLHGTCKDPNICDCNPGFHGRDCASECPRGYWGENCARECNCVNGRCDRVLGCACDFGWIGVRCESICPDGYYGFECKNKCNCSGATCHHMTGKCITTTTEATTSQSTAFTTETLIQSTTERDEISTSDTTQSHSVLTETSTEFHTTTDWSTPTNYLPEIINENVEIFVDSKTDLVYEINQTVEEIGPVNSETVTVTEMKHSEADNLESTSTVVTKPTTEVKTFETEMTTMRISREGNERETNFVNNEMAQSTTIFPLGTVNEPKIDKDKTSWISVTARKEDADKNKTDNFIFEGKGNSDKETILRFLHFLPSLSVISAASFLIVIIVGRWMIVNHRKRTRMLVMVAPKKGDISLDDGVKFHAENLFWVNNCTVNPVYMSDVDLNNPTPVLQTFKPLDKEKEKTVAQ